MQDARQENGWTLIETIIVVAIIGVLCAMTVPMMVRYRLSEDARSQANTVARAISDARSQAMSGGNPTFLLFDDPSNPNANIPQLEARRFALLVDDLDANGQFNGADTARNFHLKDGLAAEVSGWGQDPSGSQPFSNAPLAPEDAVAGQLADLNEATTFPLDPNTGAPAIGFNSQGIPVSLATPTNWGTGAGAYYVTDNNQTVYAVIVLPLGGVRVRVLSPSEGAWH